MHGRQTARTEAIRIWSSWFLLWVVWVISTTLGWALAGMLTLGMAFAFAIPDPDAAQAYVSSPLGERIFDGLMLGAMVGLIPALLIALFWVVLRRSARDVAWAVLVTILGSALLCVVGRGGGPQIESSFVTMLRLGVLGGVIGGGFVGICQWIILRRRVSRINGWIGLTVAGWVIGWTITLWGTGLTEQLFSALPISWATGPIEQGGPDPILSTAALVVGGAVVGSGQWLLLRQNVRRAGWWILATTIGWVIAAGAGVGAITGTALVLLLHHAPRSPQQTAA
jgi:hypothetical protein